MKEPPHLDKIIKHLKTEIKPFANPISTEIGDTTSNPFLVLISCLLSLRTKDTTTGPACKRLFTLADTPQKMLTIPKEQIEKAIYPVGFYPTKARWILQVCKKLIEEYGGKVPATEEGLLSLPGIGRKCMGIVMCYGFQRHEYIPVDSHLHQIANRLGWVKTRTPEQTEQELLKIIPLKYRRDLNNDLVAHGQNVCVPISPFCSRCMIAQYCPRIGVQRSR